jgi:WD repeat-containing protein 35
LDRKIINIEPSYVYMTKSYVFIASSDHVYVWQYKNQVARLTKDESIAKKFGRETAFFVDDAPNMNALYEKDKYDPTKECNDPICAITANENMLIIARSSGNLFRYALPHLTVEAKMFIKYRPNIMEINCSSVRIAIVDINGILSFFDMDNQGGGAQVDFEKSEVWQIKWSDDDPTHLACMEKSRLCTLKDLKPEEPLQTDGYIFDFSDLRVRLVYLDELMKNPDANFNPEDFMTAYETKMLKDTKELLHQGNLAGALKAIKENPHPKLWKYLAERSLEELDFSMAENAFVKCSDYQSLQLCKRLQLIDDKNKQKAEILAFTGKYDEAEALYRKLERRDLAIQLRMKIGDWFKVVELVQEGYGNDDILNQAYNKIGDYYSDRFKWKLAANFYKKCNNYEKLIEMYYNMEEYDSLKSITDALPEGNPLLIELGNKFQSVGLCEEAVDAFSKGGNVKSALDCCVLLNQWAKAVELAEKNNFVQIEGLISMYANQLTEKKRKLEVVELYRKANRNTEAAKMLGQIAADLVKSNVIHH